jgi:hypothetical protein
MPILVACPGCSTKLNAPDAAAGKRVKCPKPQCGMIVPVPAPVTEAPAFEVVEDEPAAPPPKPKTKPLIAAVEADDDDRPRSRRRRDEDEEGDRPRKRRRDDNEDDTLRQKNGIKSGKGAGAIVGIALGFIFQFGLFGVGIYAFVGGGGSKAPVPAGWVEYKSDSDKFKAFFPTKPAEPTTMQVRLVGGMSGVESVTVHMMEPKGDSSPIAGVIVFTFRPGTSPGDREKVFKAVRLGFIDAITNHSSGDLEVRWAGKKAYQVRIGSQGKKGGRSSKIANDMPFEGLVRHLATDTHGYIGIFISLGSREPKKEEADGFFDNFEFFN